jgi:hypothetical protein
VNTAPDWVRLANRRPVGRTEFREVTIEVGRPGGRRLRVRTLRAIDGDRARTVTCVVEPAEFTNINYVVEEWRGRVAPFHIALFLPYAGGSLRTLEPYRRRDSLLGSEFSYDDMRVWLYEEEHTYTTVERRGAVVCVRGRCAPDSAGLVRSGAAPFDVWLRVRDGFVDGIDYLSDTADSVLRRYRAEETMVVDGVTLPARMTMTDHRTGRRTTIFLERAAYDVAVDPAVFEPPARPDTLRHLSAL